MLKNWFSRLNVPIYIYMLQVTDYCARDYLRWLRKERNFSSKNIEKRKKRKKTVKFIFLTVVTTFFALAITSISLLMILVGTDGVLILGVVLFVAMPYILGYSAVVFSLVIKKTQHLAEIMIVRKAKAKMNSNKSLVIAVAGSFGKTTTREIIKTVLSSEKIVKSPPNNNNTPLGISRFILKEITGDEDVLVFELGEYYPGDIKMLCEVVNPQIGVITGVNEAHLERFKSLSSTASTIFELAHHKTVEKLYINGESALALNFSSPEHYIYTSNGCNDLLINNIKSTLNGLSLTLSESSYSIDATSRLLGKHHLEPIAVAASIAKDLNFSLNQIKRGISCTKPFPHRFSPTTNSGGVTVIDDSYNGNPTGVEAAIKFLKELAERRRFYLTPGLLEMGSVSSNIHINIGKMLAESGIENIILVETFVTNDIVKGLKDGNFNGNIYFFKNMALAVAAIDQLTVKNDVVFIQNDWPDYLYNN